MYCNKNVIYCEFMRIENKKKKFEKNTDNQNVKYEGKYKSIKRNVIIIL